jgi:hypothetical protein
MTVEALEPRIRQDGKLKACVRMGHLLNQIS